MGVLFFDVDHFKLVNDSLGHPAGDLVLRELAQRLSRAVREGDTLARFGGDEFVVVCEDLADIDEALEIARRFAALIDDTPLLVDRTERIVTVSAGVAVSEPGESASTLLRDADAAMNLAKERGRARVEGFSGELRNHAIRRLDLDTALRRALEHDDLHLVYQPVLALETGVPVGCEALLRWEHPDPGPDQPGRVHPAGRAVRASSSPSGPGSSPARSTSWPSGTATRPRPAGCGWPSTCRPASSPTPGWWR